MAGVLQEARTLAKFANIKEDAPAGSELSPDYFRNNYHGFVPNVWWGDLVKQKEPKKKTEPDPESPPFDEEAFKAIEAKDLPYLMAPASRPHISGWREAHAILQHAWGGFTPKLAIRLIALSERRNDALIEIASEYLRDHGDLEGIDLDNERDRIWPFQEAVMFLAVEPWRARVCAWCGNKFVAAKQRSTYCSSQCSEKAYPARYRKYNLKRKMKRRKRK